MPYFPLPTARPTSLFIPFIPLVNCLSKHKFFRRISLFEERGEIESKELFFFLCSVPNLKHQAREDIISQSNETTTYRERKG